LREIPCKGESSIRLRSLRRRADARDSADVTYTSSFSPVSSVIDADDASQKIVSAYLINIVARFFREGVSADLT